MSDDSNGKAPEPKTSAHENHNVLADEIVRTITIGTAKGGGKWLDMLVLLETVVFGTVVIVRELQKTKDGATIIDAVCAGAKKRLAKYDRSKIIRP
jgi:hypothetical protein